MSNETTDMTATATYEALYTQLQEVVARLEAGELALDEMLRLYEQGIHLAAECQRLLDQADMRVQVLQNTVGSIPIE
jgi:exodeoxyribonuclease VII small subunit